jgi:outer membrane protein W
MKKICKYIAMLSIAVTASLAVNAQETGVNNFKPGKGMFELEVGFAPFQHGISLQGVGINSADTLNSFRNDQIKERVKGGEIKGAYILNDRFKISMGLGFGTIKESTNDLRTEWTKRKTKRSCFSLTPGITYSFEGTNKLAPYIGAELLFATESTKSITEHKSGDKQVTKNEKEPLFNTFGVGIVSGFNYYFAQHLFVGVEVGTGFEFSSPKKYFSETTTDNSINKTEGGGKVRETGISIFANPSLRLGWAF